MILLPAIDLYKGNVVRLRKGEFSDSTVFPDAPEEAALRFRQAGAECIHVIDLEGAEYGRPIHANILPGLKRHGMRIHFGGGLRTPGAIETALIAGADAVYVGSALADPALAATIFARFADRIIPAVDVRGDRTAVDGWKTTTHETPEQSVERLTALGWKTFLVTSVERDGCGLGPDIALYERILTLFPELSILAAGGTSTLSDIRALRETGLAGAVLGRALYDGKLDLARAFAEASAC